MAYIKKKSALGKIFKAKKDEKKAAVDDFVGGGASLVGGSPIITKQQLQQQERMRKMKPQKKWKMQWQTHRERINGYFFPLEGEGSSQESGQEGGNYYCFVGIYKDKVVIHFRVYIETQHGDLIPTKEGCCLNSQEYEKLAELAPNATEAWKEEGIKNETLRHPLSTDSDWFLLVGENEDGEIRIAIKLLLATNKAGEFETLNKGAVLNVAQFGRFCNQIEKINDAVKDMNGYLTPPLAKAEEKN